ncbi:MAG: MFS transporter [Actinomycetota bacterium]|nr:MFS transporter [Actinomycetota bacterium]
MFARYLQVLRRPGAARFSAAGALARMQMSMTGVGAVLLLSAVRDSYGLAGLVSAIYTITSAVIGPQISRFIDAHGQRRIVPRQLTVHVAAVSSMIAVGVYTQLTWPIYLLAVLAGACQPNIGSLVRARWSQLMAGSPQLRTAFAFEALIDEVVFIIGPVLATVLALQLFSGAALMAAMLLLVVGSFFLLRQRSSEPTPSGQSGAKGKSAIRLSGVAGLFSVMIMLGGVFGSLEVTTLATTKAAGHPGMAGWMLAGYSFGSLASGLVFGAMNVRGPIVRHFVGAIAVLAVVSMPLVFLGPLWLLSLGLFVAGLAVAPALISGMSLLERIVPANRLTESMSWSNSGISLGLASSMPLAGFIADHHPPHLGYLVLSGCAVGALAIAMLVLRVLRRAQDASPVAGTPSDAATLDQALVEAGGQ